MGAIVKLGDGSRARLNMLVFDEADPRHVGELKAIHWGVRGKVRWIDTGWFSDDVPLESLRRYCPDDHLTALELRLSHERVRLHSATSDRERELRGVWVAQVEAEIARERARLGIADADDGAPDMTPDELLQALNDESENT